MRIRVRIERIVLGGTAWSERERRAFALSFGPALQLALRIQVGKSDPAARRAAREQLRIIAINTTDPHHAAAMLAPELAALLLCGA